MSNNNENMGLSDKSYTEIYDANIIGCINTFSRSYSSGINAPSVSTNRLRVYSTDSTCPGPLRVRSSPSSPNRLSKFQCTALVKRKWSALNKINQSSSSEFDSYPTSCNSNKSLQLDSNTDQHDLSWRHDPSRYSFTNRPNSCQNLKVADFSTYNQDDFYPLTGDLQTKLYGSSSTNVLFKPLSDVIDEEPNEKFRLQSKLEIKKEKHGSKLSHGYVHKDGRSVASKQSVNPVNFKKVLRDRYLNSQKLPSLCSVTATTSESSQQMTQTISLTDDCLFHSNEFTLPECDDHNFNFMQDRNSQRSLDTDNYASISSYDSSQRKSLSIDLQNLSALKKSRIRSNNSTVSSMSGIEADGDPFSPASTEICSPFLKLNLPYLMPHKQMSGCCTPNTIPSFSHGHISSTQETPRAQRFFPETMKLSDFHLHPTNKSDCQLNFSVKERLMLPETSDDQVSSKSAPQSLQLSPNCTNLLSGSLTPIGHLTTDSLQSLHPMPVLNSEEDIYFLRPMISSKSMDYLDSCFLNVDQVTDKISKVDETDWIKQDEYRDNEPGSSKSSNRGHKLKHSSVVNQTPKKSIPSNSLSSQRQCSVCGRQFNRSDMLARHLRVHTGHKPFECSICGQSFSRSDHLNTHMRIHSGEKPYRCSLCPYSACRRDMITRHLRVHRRKGDISQESISVLVVNTQQRSITTPHKTLSLTKSHNSLNLDLGSISDDNDDENTDSVLQTLQRSHSFNHRQHQCPFTEHSHPVLSLVSSSSTSSTTRTTTEPSTVGPQTFANISISICHPTPRSSFSFPMEPQNDS